MEVVCLLKQMISINSKQGRVTVNVQDVRGGHRDPAEKVAITTEGPRYNRQHNRGRPISARTNSLGQI